LLSMICVFFFFRNIRSTVIVALSIPICLLATVGLLKTIGITLNILTVAGLIVAMGRVIDDTIVILDNMYRKVHESEGNVNTTLLTGAVREMIPAIISSTATTVAVYIPIALVGGMISAAFSGFAWSVVFALVTSLFVSIFIVPALYYLWRKGQAKDSAISVEPVAQKVLHWVFQKKGKVIVLFSLLFVVAAVGAALFPFYLFCSLSVSFFAGGEHRYLCCCAFLWLLLALSWDCSFLAESGILPHSSDC
jgi:multidrug efflux pump subunit AcrB